MDVGDLLRRLRRRGRLVVGVVLVAVIAAGISWATAGSSQRSGAAVVIVPPTLGTAVSDQNPLLNLGDNLAELAVVLSAALNSSAATSELRARGATGTFTVSTVTGDNPSFARLSPQLVFTVTSADGSKAKRTATALVAVARTQLAALQAQADVPSDARAVLVQVVAPTTPEAAGGGRLRSAGSIGLALLVIGFILVLVWDEFRHRRFEHVQTAFRRPRLPGRLDRVRRRGEPRPPAYAHDDAPRTFRSR